MKKTWLPVILAVVWIISLAAGAYAWPADLGGMPKQFTDGVGSAGYCIWQDEYGIHIWTRTGGENHVFLGEIRSDGRFYQVRGHHLEGRESFYAYPNVQNQFWFETLNSLDSERFVSAGQEVDYSPHKINIKFGSSDGSDGIKFFISGGSYVTFDLLMDGQGIARKQIWIGGAGWHPDSHMFRLSNR